MVSTVVLIELYLCFSETELILRQRNMVQNDISGLLRLDGVLDQIGAQNFVSVLYQVVCQWKGK